MFFSGRRRGGPDLHLDWKVRICFAGALIAFIGMILESSLRVLVAIAVLLVGVFLRFLPGRTPGTLPEDEKDPPEAEAGPSVRPDRPIQAWSGPDPDSSLECDREISTIRLPVELRRPEVRPPAPPGL